MVKNNIVFLNTYYKNTTSNNIDLYSFKHNFFNKPIFGRHLGYPFKNKDISRLLIFDKQLTPNLQIYDIETSKLNLATNFDLKTLENSLETSENETMRGFWNFPKIGETIISNYYQLNIHQTIISHFDNKIKSIYQILRENKKPSKILSKTYFPIETYTNNEKFFFLAETYEKN